jgi:hypothetical protein
MSDKHWDSVVEYIGNPKLELGPFFAYQVLETPRHLVFVLSRYKFVSKIEVDAEIFESARQWRDLKIWQR